MIPTLTTNQSLLKDFYKVGAYIAVLVALLIVFAIAAFFIWPYQAGDASAAQIFDILQKDPLGGLMSLDLMMLVIAPFNLLLMLALYAALKPVHEGYALFALLLGIVATALLIPTRPLVELVSLSERYAAAVTEAEQTQLLLMGESQLLLFEGTAWLIQTIIFIVAGLINAFLMLNSNLFKKATAYIGIIVSVLGLLFLVPVIGALFLFLNTIGSVLWNFLVAKDFLAYGKNF